MTYDDWRTMTPTEACPELEERDEPDCCELCNGSGEGQADMTTCRDCGGTGEARPERDDEDAYYDAPDDDGDYDEKGWWM